MKRAKHTYKIPAKHFRELVFINLFFSGFGALGKFVFNWGDIFFNIMVGVGVGISFLLWLAGAVRRRNTTLVAEMNDATWNIRVWMSKPIQFWKNMLVPSSNVIQLDEVTNAFVKDMNGNSTLVLKNDKESYKSFYLPERLALVKDVKSFFLDFLDSNEGKKMDKKTRQVIVDFLQV